MSMSMFPGRVVGLLAVGTGVLWASTSVALSAGQRAHLGADELAVSRGSNPLFVLAEFSCNVFNDSGTCSQANAPCTSCSTDTYTGVDVGVDGNYEQSIYNEPGCGDIALGVCNAALVCVTNPPGPVGCSKPEFPDTQH